MEGFYQDGKDGMHERPGDKESTVTWQGEPLPYLPYAYRHPEYWQRIVADSKAGGDRIASRKMFDESERRHPIREEERIKVEKIRGKIIFIGAEDDVLWDTCKYIRRMEERLERLPHDSVYELPRIPAEEHAPGGVRASGVVHVQSREGASKGVQRDAARYRPAAEKGAGGMVKDRRKQKWRFSGNFSTRPGSRRVFSGS